MYGLLYECKFLTIEETNKKKKKKKKKKKMIYRTQGEHANHYTKDEDLNQTKV
jgi:hypothetical protein